MKKVFMQIKDPVNKAESYITYYFLREEPNVIFASNTNVTIQNGKILLRRLFDRYETDRNGVRKIREFLLNTSYEKQYYSTLDIIIIRNDNKSIEFQLDENSGEIKVFYMAEFEIKS